MRALVLVGIVVELGEEEVEADVLRKREAGVVVQLNDLSDDVEVRRRKMALVTFPSTAGESRFLNHQMARRLQLNQSRVQILPKRQDIIAGEEIITLAH